MGGRLTAALAGRVIVPPREASGAGGVPGTRAARRRRLGVRGTVALVMLGTAALAGALSGDVRADASTPIPPIPFEARDDANRSEPDPFRTRTPSGDVPPP